MLSSHNETGRLYFTSPSLFSAITNGRAENTKDEGIFSRDTATEIPADSFNWLRAFTGVPNNDDEMLLLISPPLSRESPECFNDARRNDYFCRRFYRRKRLPATTNRS